MSLEFGYKYEKPYEPPQKVSAYAEMRGNGLESRFIQTPEELAGRIIWLADGSSSVANCRGIEIATTLIAAKNLEGKVQGIVTDIVGGGAAELALNDLGINLNRLEQNEEIVHELQQIFPRVIFDEKNARFLSAEAYVFPGSGRTLRNVNLRAREALLQGAAHELGITLPNIAVVGSEDLEHTKDITLKDLLEQQAGSPDQMVMKVTCPDCSRMQQTIVEHGILPDGSVVKHHQFAVKCKGGKDLANAIQDEGLSEKSVSDLVKLGFYISGKAIYRLTTNSLDPQRDALLVRNYSNSRGTMTQIAQECKAPIGITQRFYFQNKKDIPGKDFMHTLKNNPELQEAIHNQELLVTGRDTDVFLPC